MKKIKLILITLLFSNLFFAQNNQSKQHFFLYWGYNRSAYTTSDIRMVGKGYDYTISNVVATDKPSPFDPKVYFNITQLSIPQFNIRGGWQWKEKLWLSLGYDHMKYVVKGDQNVMISGTISDVASTKYAGNYNANYMILHEDFLRFEHTDGLNFISTDIDYAHKIWTSKSEKQYFEHRLGASLGILYPRTDVIIFDHRGPNIWNLAGVGVALKSQLRFYFFSHFFFEAGAKAGKINLPKIQTTGFKGEFAQQKFWFLEGYLVLGYKFSL